MFPTILTVLVTATSFWKLDSEDRYPKLKDFAPKMSSTFGNTYMCESTHIFHDEANEIYSENRN